MGRSGKTSWKKGLVIVTSEWQLVLTRGRQNKQRHWCWTEHDVFEGLRVESNCTDKGKRHKAANKCKIMDSLAKCVRKCGLYLHGQCSWIVFFSRKVIGFVSGGHSDCYVEYRWGDKRSGDKRWKDQGRGYIDIWIRDYGHLRLCIGSGMHRWADVRKC